MGIFCIPNKSEKKYIKAIIKHCKSKELEYNSAFYPLANKYGENIKILLNKKDIKTIHKYNKNEIKELENAENEVSEDYIPLLGAQFYNKIDNIKKLLLKKLILLNMK